MSLLDIRNLSVRFGAADAIPVVDGLDLSVDEGEVLAIVGESGSGKSVTMMALMGLIDAPGIVRADSLRFDGHDMLALKGRQRRQVVGKDLAMVFQDPMTALSLRVDRIDALTPQIRRLVLRTTDGSALPAYAPGAHVELHVPGPRPLRRAYSLVTPCDGGDRLEIAVQLEAEGSGGSRWVHGLAEGEVIGASAPKNLFPLIDAAESHLLLAGGIGITPILCMARALAAAGQRYALHYAARERDRAAYCAEVEALEHARCWFDGGAPARGMPLAEVIGAPAAGRHLYVCGPKVIG